MSLTTLSHSKASSGSHLRSTGESTPCPTWISPLGRYFELGAWGSFLLLTAVPINSLGKCDNPANACHKIKHCWAVGVSERNYCWSLGSGCYLSWNSFSPCVRLVQKLFPSNGDKTCCWVFSRTALWYCKDRTEFWPCWKLLGFFGSHSVNPVVLLL